MGLTHIRRFFSVVMPLMVLMLSGCIPVTAAVVRVPRVASTAAAWDALDGDRGPTGLVTITDNADAWAARWELLTDARSTIDVSTFIFHDDAFGFAVLGALTERALAGVQVRLLLDGRGSIAMATPLLGRDYLQEMVATGHVDVHIFNPPLDELVGALIKLDAVQISAGSHNKIMVIDKSIAIVGGRNVNANYFSTLRENPNAVDDADVLVDGVDVVAALTDIMDREFSAWRRDDVAADIVNMDSKLDELLMFAGAMDAWVRGTIELGPPKAMLAALRSAARARIDHDPLPRTVERLEVRLENLLGYPSVRATVPVSNLPRTQVNARVVSTISRARAMKQNAATDAFVAAIAGARSDIIIQSPSFILNPLLLRAFQEAGERGVTITILTNSPLSSDSNISQALFIDSWPELMVRIPNLRIFTPRIRQMQHAKRAVFDGDLSFVSTYNLDPFSTKMNSETIVATDSQAVASEARASLRARLPDMDEYRVARTADGVVRRYPEQHPLVGQVVVVFGPRDQVTAEEIDVIEGVKDWLLGFHALWDFEVVVW